MVQCPVCQGDTTQTEIRLGTYSIYKCLACSLRFAPDARDIPVDYGNIYNTPEYQEVQTQDLLKAVNKPQIFADHITYRPFFKRVGQEKGMRLLDVGCGVGRFCHAAYSHNWDVTGIDISANAIAIGKQFARFPIHHLTLEEMLHRNQRFDVVTAFEILEHLTAPVELLKHCHQIMTEQGELFCTVPNWDCAEVQTADRRDWIPPVHLNFFTGAALKRAGVEAGFSRSTIGTIWTHPFPKTPRNQLRWIKQRLFGRRSQPLGLWMHAKK